jgi:adenosylcobinamide kinase/adenosylcobinamide-phosphate guanylyltransferase
MKRTIFVIGGCRSGKSRHAIGLSEKAAAANRVYVATCEPLDDEMKARVKKHQSERDHTWKTVEIPVDLARGIETVSSCAEVILIDCLTLWVTNMLMREMEEREIMNRTDSLLKVVSKLHAPVIFVSNEVGAGIVPDNELARRFRDMAGFVNQKIAAAADEVILMVAGIPVHVKPGQG